MVAIVSFLAPLAGEGAGFLRVLRTLRLLHTYQLLARLRADSAWFRRNEELAITIVHLTGNTTRRRSF
jgi:voltage-gated potassium channel